MYVSYTEKEIVFEQLKTEFNWDLPLWTRRTILTSIQIVILSFWFHASSKIFLIVQLIISHTAKPTLLIECLSKNLDDK